MTLQVELSPEQESWLKQSAASTGVDQRAALLAALERQRTAEDPLAGLSEDEAQLRREISRPLPAEIQARHRELFHQGRERPLTAEEHREWTELLDIVETRHAARVARALKLAQLCGANFDELLGEFGLRQPVH